MLVRENTVFLLSVFTSTQMMNLVQSRQTISASKLLQRRHIGALLFHLFWGLEIQASFALFQDVDSIVREAE